MKNLFLVFLLLLTQSQSALAGNNPDIFNDKYELSTMLLGAELERVWDVQVTNVAVEHLLTDAFTDRAVAVTTGVLTVGTTLVGALGAMVVHSQCAAANDDDSCYRVPITYWFNATAHFDGVANDIRCKMLIRQDLLFNIGTIRNIQVNSCHNQTEPTDVIVDFEVNHAALVRSRRN